MLRWTLLFLILALVAGALGFWQVEGLSMWIAKVLFIAFLVLILLALLFGKRTPVV